MKKNKGLIESINSFILRTILSMLLLFAGVVFTLASDVSGNVSISKKSVVKESKNMAEKFGKTIKNAYGVYKAVK